MDVTAKEKYPVQRYLKFERLVLVKEKGGYYHIPEIVQRPVEAYDTIVEVLRLHEEPQEVFGVICLNVKNKVISIDKVSVGSLTESIVHPREVFKVAILKNAASIILFHNHPSGDTTPSKEDIEVTKRMVECGQLMGINVLDHIIVGDGCYLSMKERGLM